MRISDWSSDVCSSDLHLLQRQPALRQLARIPAPVGRCAKQAVGLVEVDAVPKLEAVPQPDHFAMAGIGGQRHRIECRSEERRVGHACGSTCRSRWAPYHEKKNKQRKYRKRQKK